MLMMSMRDIRLVWYDAVINSHTEFRPHTLCLIPVSTRIIMNDDYPAIWYSGESID